MSAMNDVEKSVKDYNTETATTWKIESAKLIDQYKDNKKDFEKSFMTLSEEAAES